MLGLLRLLVGTKKIWGGRGSIVKPDVHNVEPKCGVAHRWGGPGWGREERAIVVQGYVHWLGSNQELEQEEERYNDDDVQVQG